MTKTFLTLLILLFPLQVFAGDLDVGLFAKSGITDSQLLYFGIDTEIKKISLISKFNYGKQNSLKIENNAFLRLGYDSKLSEKWSLWFFDQIEYNKLRKIDFENFFGGGPKYSFCKNFSISAGYLQHHQRIEYDTLNINRFSFRLKDKVKLFRVVAFTGIIFYQPNLKDFDDYIFTGEASIKQKIAARLSLKLLLTDQYRSRSETDEKNDLSLILSLGIKI